MGDTSDNIPGVPSIGEKTATKIIVEYQTIENAYAHVEEIKPPRASKALKEHYDMARMSKNWPPSTSMRISLMRWRRDGSGISLRKRRTSGFRDFSLKICSEV